MTRNTGSPCPLPVVSASAVSLAIADFLVKTEMERLRLFGEHLRATVVEVSPLLLGLAASEQVDIDAAVATMRPPGDWPWRTLYDPVTPIMRQWRTRQLLIGHGAKRGVGRLRRAFADPGVVIRPSDHPRGWLGIRPCGGVLGFATSLGPCLLSAFDTMAMIGIPEPLPETLVTGLPGRRLDQLIDHPMFRHRDYVISRVLTDPTGAPPVLVFKVPLVPFAMPSADGVDASWPEDVW